MIPDEKMDENEQYSQIDCMQSEEETPPHSTRADTHIYWAITRGTLDSATAKSSANSTSPACPHKARSTLLTSVNSSAWQRADSP